MNDWMNEGKRLNESVHVREAYGFYGNGAAREAQFSSSVTFIHRFFLVNGFARDCGVLNMHVGQHPATNLYRQKESC